MAINNRERIDKALGHLREGLTPFVEQELEAQLGDSWLTKANESLTNPRTKDHGVVDWDTYSLLKVMWDQWNTVFRHTLGHTDRNYVSELRTARNDHAHEKSFSYDDTERALDSTRRLLTSVGASAQADFVQNSRKELIRVQQAEDARRETRKAAAMKGSPSAGLKPWRDVIAPHPDVSGGKYQDAEFAADLAKVHEGSAAEEYCDPKAFFARTFITDGLRDLLTIGVNRLTGNGGDPVVELKTNFGGGKTHSMLALYHLFGGGNASDLPGAGDILNELGVSALKPSKRAVLVGTELPSNEKRKKPDGTVVHTMWGELAWQLGGKEGYQFVKDSDHSGTNPGSGVLEELLKQYSPCLILIDEWVAFLRNLPGKDNLSAGTYDSNLSFAQSLTEAVKTVPEALVVASLPQSDIEIGGTNGAMALESLSNTFKRVAKPWQPASNDEGFEIVKRRLFNLEGIDHAALDATVNAFSEMYSSQSGEFPSMCKEQDYKRRLKACYPIHPELFDRLDQDWSTLERFQRTRGVLRLMAAVTHALWGRDDRSLMILPASVTLDAGPVRSLITECLEAGTQWDGILSKDVDGPHALSHEIDGANSNLGRYSATRRVARTIFMGAAPTVRSATPGVEDNSIRLGCAQPGEAVATFGDALRRITDRATYLYADKGRYWFSLQATVSNLARDRAEGLKGKPDVTNEIVRLLREEKSKGAFAAVHIAPADSSEVSDDLDTRLIVLGPEVSHKKNASESSARALAEDILEKRGSSARQYRNAVIFLAASAKELENLESAICQYLAWESINKDAKNEVIELTNFAKSQAQDKVNEGSKTCALRIRETWSLALVPYQPAAEKPDIKWEDHSVSGEGSLAERVSKKLISVEAFFDTLGAPRLKVELDRYLWNQDKTSHVGLKYVRECFASYLYMPRIADEAVLRQAVEGAFAGSMFCEQFGYATGYGESENRYTGLQTTILNTAVLFDGASVLVKPEIATAQAEADRIKQAQLTGGAESSSTSPMTGEPDNDDPADSTSGSPSSTTAPTLPKSFFATLELDPTKAAMQFGDAMQEVFQHFTSKVGSKATIKVEFEAEDEKGFDESLQRTVRENSKTLGFDTAEFEE